jgi:hypothetical protein
MKDPVSVRNSDIVIWKKDESKEENLDDWMEFLMVSLLEIWRGQSMGEKLGLRKVISKGKNLGLQKGPKWVEKKD